MSWYLVGCELPVGNLNASFVLKTPEGGSVSVSLELVGGSDGVPLFVGFEALRDDPNYPRLAREIADRLRQALETREAPLDLPLLLCQELNSEGIGLDE